MANGLVADIGSQLAMGLPLGAQIQQQQLQQDQLAQQQAQQEQLGGLIGGLVTDPASDVIQFNPQVAADLATQFPDKFEQINTNLGLITEGRKKEALDFSFKVRGTPFEQRQALIQQRAERLQSQGRDPSDTLDLLNLAEKDQNQALDLVQVAALSPEQRVELSQGPEPTTLQRELIAAGLTPGTPEFQQAIMNKLTGVLSPEALSQKAAIAEAGGTKVTVGGKAEGKEREEIAKVRAKQFERLIQSGEKAESMLQSLDTLDAIDIDTGALEPGKVALASVVEGLGIDASSLADVGTAQSFKAVSNRLVNDVLNAATGPQTDGDAQRARSTISNLGDSPLAAQFKSNSLRSVALRTIEQRDFIESRVDEGSTFSEARKEWNKFKKQTPALSDAVKNPQTGLPLYFYQFQNLARQRREGITDKEIIAAWRQANAK